jgi:hypothetical protein
MKNLTTKRLFPSKNVLVSNQIAAKFEFQPQQKF